MEVTLDTHPLNLWISMYIAYTRCDFGKRTC